jgi:hypothetical protein
MTKHTIKTNLLRLPYDPRQVHLHKEDILVYRTRKGERLIHAGNWWVNRCTPVGEDAELWESKSFNGAAQLSRSEIIAVLRAKEQADRSGGSLKLS